MGDVSKGQGSEMDNYLNRVDATHWRAGRLESVPVRFGGGQLEKDHSSGTSLAAYPTGWAALTRSQCWSFCGAR